VLKGGAIALFVHGGDAASQAGRHNRCCEQARQESKHDPLEQAGGGVFLAEQINNPRLQPGLAGIGNKRANRFEEAGDFANAGVEGRDETEDVVAEDQVHGCVPQRQAAGVCLKERGVSPEAFTGGAKHVRGDVGSQQASLRSGVGKEQREPAVAATEVENVAGARQFGRDGGRHGDATILVELAVAESAGQAIEMGSHCKFHGCWRWFTGCFGRRRRGYKSTPPTSPPRSR